MPMYHTMSTLSDTVAKYAVYDFAEIQEAFKCVDDALMPSVVLVYPILNQGATADPVAPHALYYIRSTLEALSVPVTIYFWDVSHYQFDNVENMPPGDVYYIHPMFATVRNTCDMLRFVKEKNPDTLICLGNSDQHQHERCIGGPRDMEIAAYLMSLYPDIDMIFLGEHHEYSIVKMIHNQTLKYPFYFDLGRCAYRHRAEIMYNQIDRLFDMGTLPFLKIPDTYPAVVRIRSSVGCRAVCRYCIESSVNKTSDKSISWTGVSPERFVRELADIRNHTGRRFINIIDSSFEDSDCRGTGRLLQMIELLEKEALELSLKIHLRAETVNQLSNDELKRLKGIGVDVVIVGVESGVQDELAFFGKIAKAEESRQAILRIDDTQMFFTVLGFMMFSPITTLDMVRRKMDYLSTIHRTWDFMAYSNWLLVYWGSRMHEALKRMNQVEKDDVPVQYVSYRFSDDRVKVLAQTVDRVKQRIPSVMKLHKWMYDLGNFKARCSNPVNAHLSVIDTQLATCFERFSRLQSHTGTIYHDAMLRLADEAEKGKNVKSLVETAETCIGQVDRCEADARDIFHDLVMLIRSKKLDDSMLHVNTWFSNVNVFGVQASAGEHE